MEDLAVSHHHQSAHIEAQVAQNQGDFDRLLSDAMTHNQQLLSKIDPGLIGESRWGHGTIFLRPFVYLAHLISRVWNRSHVNLLKSFNTALTEARRMQIYNIVGKDSWVKKLVDCGVDPSKLTTLFQRDASLDREAKSLKKKGVSWTSHDTPSMHLEIKEYELTSAERAEKLRTAQEVNSAAQRSKKLRRQGMLQDYIPRGSG